LLEVVSSKIGDVSERSWWFPTDLPNLLLVYVEEDFFFMEKNGKMR